jgi:pimeloyl-ACP methyl ester carboxylesterase
MAYRTSFWRPHGGPRLRFLESTHHSDLQTILLLHGWGSAAVVYREVMDALPGHIRVVAPDLPGHGGSQPLLRGAVTMHDLVEALDGLREACISGPVIVAGSSMGANIAFHYAAAYPHAVSGIVALSPVGLRGQTGLPNALFSSPSFVKALMAVSGDLVVRAFLRRAAGGDAAVLNDELVRGYLDNFRTAANRAAVAETTKAVLADSPLEAILPRIEQPVMVIAGDSDGLVTPALARYRRLLPDAEFVEISGGCHIIHAQFARRIAAEVERFAHEVRRDVHTA